MTARMARAEVFAPDEVAVVHVMNRVVRRYYLLGNDPVSGKNYDHRKVRLKISCSDWQSGIALESSEKQWFSSFLATRDRQAGVVEFVVAGKFLCGGLPQSGQPVARIFKKKSVVGRWC